MTDPAAPVEQPAAPAPDSVGAAIEAAITAETPAPAFDPESFKSTLLAEITKHTDTRVSGLQRVFDKKLTEALQKAAPSTEDDATDPDSKAEIAQLRKRNWILERQTENPEAASLLLKFAEAESAEDQFAALAEFIAAQKAPATPTPKEAEEDVPNVDLNNPMPQEETAHRLPGGTKLTASIADRILKNLKVLPDDA